MSFLRMLLARLVPARGKGAADDGFARRLAGLPAVTHPVAPLAVFRNRPSRRAA